MKLRRYYLEKPDLSKFNKTTAIEKFEKLEEDKFREILEKANSPEYLYWDKLKYKISVDNLSPEELWFLVRQFRNIMSNKTFLKSEHGEFFRWIRLPYTDEFLNKIDMYAGGQIFPSSSSTPGKNQFVIRGIMEEAIASSQLEGAHTTRPVAKKMILENRKPHNESEQMILNNYRTIMSIEEEYKNSELSLDLMFTLHRKLTEDTISKDQQGRLRKNSDEIVVQGFIGTEQYISHIPPKEDFLNTEIQRLIEFANDKEDHKFMHPIIKAIFLHFWVGYLHPFTDGNGRLARALFYWYLLKKGYWTMMYLPISTVIKQSPVQYAMGYIYTEQDNLDLTYFYDFHIKKIIQSLNEFENYIQKNIKENHRLDEIVGKELNLNERQKRLLHYLLSDEGAGVTATSHSELNNISRQTAAKDLKELENKGMLIGKKEGLFMRYYPYEKLKVLKEKL